MTHTLPFARALADLPLESGSDPSWGTVNWKTLICGDRTPSKEFTFGVAEFGAGGTLKPHRHEAAEFYFGLEGSGEVVVDGVVHPISNGVVIYIPSNAEHGVVAGEDGLKFAYGFATRSMDDVVYRFSEPNDVV